eukprot:TRINITY_DN1060_c0_g1_i18.p1 TRINITY_DN1060_c0_g1~~TRINITY_DN1060_c0_g1_i18.p1  ORF type:complete len:278 (+),score=48.51 TRINITY_DN1060_c0_g1_i18:65-898(+)
MCIRDRYQLIGGSTLDNLTETNYLVEEAKGNTRIEAENPQDLDYVAAGCWSTEYFELKIRHNWGLWVLIAVITVYFVLAIGSKKDTEKVGPQFRNNAYTLHPFYSIYYVGGEFFTKASRITIMFVGVSVKVLGMAIIHYLVEEQDRESILWLLVGPAIAAVASSIPQYIFGIILRINLGYQKEKIMKKQKNEEDDSYSIEGSYFIFYLLAILSVLAALIMSIVCLTDHNLDQSLMWFASIWISFAYDFLIFDVIITLLAKFVPALISIFKWLSLIHI